jgi:hypothetical protein
VDRQARERSPSPHHGQQFRPTIIIRKFYRKFERWHAPLRPRDRDVVWERSELSAFTATRFYLKDVSRARSVERDSDPGLVVRAGWKWWSVVAAGDPGTSGVHHLPDLPVGRANATNASLVLLP